MYIYIEGLIVVGHYGKLTDHDEIFYELKEHNYCNSIYFLVWGSQQDVQKIALWQIKQQKG